VADRKYGDDWFGDCYDGETVIRGWRIEDWLIAPLVV
jgi:hypothetical protein